MLRLVWFLGTGPDRPIKKLTLMMSQIKSFNKFLNQILLLRSSSTTLIFAKSRWPEAELCEQDAHARAARAKATVSITVFNFDDLSLLIAIVLISLHFINQINLFSLIKCFFYVFSLHKVRYRTAAAAEEKKSRHKKLIK